jgi:serine/threonine protein kinase
MQLQENTVVADRFRLIRMIGRGGMGSVWQAQDCRLDNECAVKFIEGDLANLTDAQARFEREAKAAAQLRSPHVVEIKDYGVWQGRPYIAMELLDGEDLGKALAKAGGKLPPAQVGAVIQQVCRALTKAHAAGIVHRDLKPDNIFLVVDDDRQLVKILDFGVAKQTAQAIDGSNTKTGAMLGTPYYMSPEQAQGIKSVDARSDLWSLAVIVYHCITGRLPFESEALGDLLVKIIVNPVPVPSHVAPVPPGFDRWWARAADRNPDNRFQTAKDFGNELALALGTTATDLVAPRPAPAWNAAGTAMMPNPSAPTSPNAYTGAGPPPAHLSPHAPSGSFTTPGGGPLVQPSHPTPSGVAMGPPMMNTPSPHLGGNPATFSGVEPPFAIPKKGPPVGLLAAIGGAVVVAVLAAAFIVTRKPATSAGSGGLSASATSSVTSAPTVAATATETASPPAPSPEPEPSASTSAVASVTAAAPGGGPVVRPPVKPPSSAGAPSAKPSASAPVAPAAPSASVKKWNAGF